MKLLSLGVVVSESQVCALPSPQLCSIPLGILQIPKPACLRVPHTSARRGVTGG